MAVNATNNQAPAPTNASGTNAGVPTNTAGTNTPAIKVQPEKKPVAEPVAQSIGFWDVFWPAFILAVFAWSWRKGHLQRLKNYIGETREQLRKCTWPTRNELYQHTVVVMLSTILLALFTVAADFVIREIVWGWLLDGKTLLFKPSTGGTA